MMRHDPKWATFNSAYINERVQFDMEKVIADEPTEDCLIKLFTHMSMTRDPLASEDMVPDEIRQTLLPPDPEIMALEQRRSQLRNGRYRNQGTEHEEEIREISKLIRTKRAKRDKALRQQYREYYFYNRPTWEIEQQLAEDGNEECEDLPTDPAIDLHIPERARLADLLCHQPSDLAFNDFCQLRIEAAELMVALCSKRETVKGKRIHEVLEADIFIKEESPEPERFPPFMGKTQCPRYIGNEALSVKERTFSYCRMAVINDHFNHEHLSSMEGFEEDGPIFCEHPKCKDEGLKLTRLNHLRLHVAHVHGVKLRPCRQ